MAALTLKNVPEELMSALRAAAEHDRRSLNQQIIHLLEAAIRNRGHGDALSPTEVQAQLAAWREMAGTWRSDVELEEEIARTVGRRTRGRKVAF
jgi:hypothetical protein